MSAPGKSSADLPPEFLEGARAIFSRRLQLGEAIRLQHGRTESHFEPISPDAVIFAHSTEEMVALVRLCPGWPQEWRGLVDGAASKEDTRASIR